MGGQDCLQILLGDTRCQVANMQQILLAFHRIISRLSDRALSTVRRPSVGTGIYLLIVELCAVNHRNSGLGSGLRAEDSKPATQTQLISKL